jgi:hypothetical protein
MVSAEPLPAGPGDESEVFVSTYVSDMLQNLASKMHTIARFRRVVSDRLCGLGK